MAIEFGKLEVVNLREVCPNEANDFIPWLANNLDRLSRVIGIPLDLDGVEVPVGRFSADILARNSQDGSNVVIENQLEWLDHTHLGQIPTYLAGLKVRTVIWIASEFTEAHLDAIRWLNENTPADFSFSAFLVSVAKIGDSPLAPGFTVVERPAPPGERGVTDMTTGSESLSSEGRFSRDFWAHYADRYPRDGLRRGFAGRNPQFPVRGTKFTIRWYHARRNQVGQWVITPEARSFDSAQELVKPHVPALAKALGVNPSKMSDNAFIRLDIDISSPDNWTRAADWLHENLEIYRRVLSQAPHG